ncbi:MAG TPA: hypothetical protein VGA66_09350 [Mycobacterium sp.]
MKLAIATRRGETGRETVDMPSSVPLAPSRAATLCAIDVRYVRTVWRNG